MPISINGSGSITGISAGGLPDASIVEADIATAAVTETKVASNAITPDKLSTGGPKWDSSGRLLINTTTSIPVGAGTASNIQLADSVGFQSLSRWVDGTGGPALLLGKSRSATVGTYSVVLNGDILGQLIFAGDDGTDIQTQAASIRAEVDGTPGANDMPGRLVFTTTPDNQSPVTGPVARMTIYNDGQIDMPDVYNDTTAAAANFVIQSDGKLRRSTSSLKYKTDVETLEDSYADAVLNCRPVWYRSTSPGDNPNWGHWGFIAEEVAQVDPRLCFFKEEEDGSLEPEGVQYDRFVPHLLNLIKRQQQAIANLEADVAQLKQGIQQ